MSKSNVSRKAAAFDLTVLGCSGGPLERYTCSYLLKPKELSYDGIVSQLDRSKVICIDAGSGIYSIIEWISKIKKDKLYKENGLLDLYDDSDAVEDYTFCPTTTPFDLELLQKTSPYQLASGIMELLENYLISHPHADHIFGRVLNSPSYGSYTINGSTSTVEMLQKHVFNNRIWPQLDLIKYNVLKMGNSYQLTTDFQVQMFTNSHGSFVEGDQKIVYESNAYLIKRPESGKSILIFGDLEPDLVSNSTTNLSIWEEVVTLTGADSLLAIVIECSHYNLPSDTPLYGHMTPNYLIQEFLSLGRVLSRKFGDSKPLRGLNVIITHVKETKDGSDPRKRVLKELNELNELHDLGLIFTIALPGLTYSL